jgi:hypothetical protein
VLAAGKFHLLLRGRFHSLPAIIVPLLDRREVLGRTPDHLAFCAVGVGDRVITPVVDGEVV